MLDWTDRHCRYLLRRISRHALLYTEMVTTGAILHGRRAHLLRYDVSEHPLALQLGGSDPKQLAECTRIGADYGYDEINLNVGCPSDRVQSGRFGACLIAEPETVAACVSAMRNAVDIPVTVKTRIGIDRQDSYAEFARFIERVAAAGCERFIVHARSAWLQGLSPEQNRTVPPLRYDYAVRLKQEHPELTVILNGGIDSLDSALRHLQELDGVMLGRAVYHDPMLLSEVDARCFDDPHPLPAPVEVVRGMYPYIERELAGGTPLKQITRHLLGLFQGQPGARQWRRHLSEYAHQRDAGIEVIEQALARMDSVGAAHSTVNRYHHQHG
jgi:tRNA-dihydrouridine synthase A